jgi:hypothetical protein
VFWIPAFAGMTKQVDHFSLQQFYENNNFKTYKLFNYGG